MWESEVVKQLYLKICTTKIGMNHDINSCIYQNSYVCGIVENISQERNPEEW